MVILKSLSGSLLSAFVRLHVPVKGRLRDVENMYVQHGVALSAYRVCSIFSFFSSGLRCLHMSASLGRPEDRHFVLAYKGRVPNSASAQTRGRSTCAELVIDLFGRTLESMPRSPGRVAVSIRCFSDRPEPVELPHHKSVMGRINSSASEEAYPLLCGPLTTYRIGEGQLAPSLLEGICWRPGFAPESGDARA